MKWLYFCSKIPQWDIQAKYHDHIIACFVGNTINALYLIGKTNDLTQKRSTNSLIIVLAQLKNCENRPIILLDMMGIPSVFRAIILLLVLLGMTSKMARKIKIFLLILYFWKFFCETNFFEFLWPKCFQKNLV